jgi:hypothetical protein
LSDRLRALAVVESVAVEPGHAALICISGSCDNIELMKNLAEVGQVLNMFEHQND